MYSYKLKKFILLLSLSSFIFAFLIGILVLSLLLNDGPLNIISSPLVGIKMCISAVLVNCLFMFVLTVICSSERSEDRSFFQPYSFIKSCGLLLLSSVIFHIISILYGAPVLISVEETYTFSVLMSVLVILPLCLFCGPLFDSWYDIFTSSSYLGIETIVYYTSIMSILGSWAGAAAIPLDWDRPWQAWPISCAVGAIFGYCLGLLFGAVQLPRELLNNKWKVI